jgi:hypothetical protein
MATLPQSGGRGDAEEPFDLPDEPHELPGEEELKTYDLVILNDDTHSFEYVMSLFHEVLGIEWDTGFGMAETIDAYGGRVVFTGTWREVKQKRGEIRAYGPDPLTGEAEPLQVEIHECS